MSRASVMTRSAIAVAATATTLALSGCWALLARAEFEPGQQVAAKWHASWYGATITGRDGEKFAVRYDDGDTGTVTAAELRRPLARHEVRVGLHVIASWKGGARWFPGLVTAVDDAGATVRWDDGDAPSDAPFGKIAAD